MCIRDRSQAWQPSGEAVCEADGYGRLPITVTGHLAAQEQLQVRLGTWQAAATAVKTPARAAKAKVATTTTGSTAYTDPELFDISK